MNRVRLKGCIDKDRDKEQSEWLFEGIRFSHKIHKKSRSKKSSKVVSFVLFSNALGDFFIFESQIPSIEQIFCQ